MNTQTVSLAGLNRNVVFAVLITAAFLNFVFAAAGQSIGRDGLWPAIYATFGISAIIWVAMLYTVSLILDAPDAKMRPADVAVSALALVAILVPHKYVPVLVLSGAAGYLILFTHDTLLRKAGILLAAITVPLLWGNLVLLVFNETILEIDAFLVALVAQTERVGNVVINADAGWYIKISKGCSTLSNISIGILSWTFFVLFYDRTYGRYRYWWMLAIFVPIVIINVGRMAIVLIRPETYEFIHDGAGADIANMATLLVIVGLCLVGVKRPNETV